MKTQEKNDDAQIPRAERGPSAANGAKKHARKKILRSIRVRTLVSYGGYATAILLLLWTCFCLFLFGFYGRQLRDDFDSVSAQISSPFPNRIDDRSFELYKVRISDTVRREAVTVTVFVDGEDGYDTVFTMDTLGNVIDTKIDTFDMFMELLDAEEFTGGGHTERLTTDIGEFLCYLDAHDIVTGEGKDTAYILIIKPFELLSPTAKSIIFALIVCSNLVLGLAVCSAFILSQSNTKRIKDISQKAKKLADGDYSVVFSGGGCDEYDNLAAALNMATEEMDKTEQLRRDVIANVSHDIRTPLTMIRGYAEMIRDMPLDEQKRKHIADIIIDETDRLNMLSGDVLSLSKLQSGVVELDYERVNMSKLARSTLAQFDIFAERDGIVFDCDIDENAFAVCDAHRIMQVLYNFVSNAINYCGDDKTIVLRVKKIDNGVRVEIGDHGAGIAADELETVWTRYYRSTQTRRAAVGTGLGLSICKNILDRHNARYSVASELGKGTVFSFELDDEEKPSE